MHKYRKSQFEKVEANPMRSLRVLKLSNTTLAGSGVQTNWLNITEEEYQKIKKILTGEKGD